ncbi:MAG: DASS family sodium-coupled anion symporter [Bacteroidetes bacterium]|nr:DASS family sodium-coupled anion symporter [Bacteroidota bacterium]MBX7129714.1 DASS family sodium-coupled anion symporter [Flavobacteriales bacterium]MCC6655472.1 DASS family sodium-coupled anion symporter [Flavobacteriales bacterium]HMU13927.1 DASS family sodium-coupled anion symporter [Flavobacteriales bacterium]HMZ48190.1 DASS family sodium-coupled anion symporter [Flavobacteriales bacterium]
MRKVLFTLAGPVAALLGWWGLRHLGYAQAAVAGAVLWMAVWWISEAVPLAVTSLLPVVLFPLLGITDLPKTASFYGKDVNFLFIGGFLLALGIERSGLHRRIALAIVARIGTAPSRLILGALLATGLLSMWVNSTAAVLVMLPIGLSLLNAAPEHRNLGAALALSVGYGASIGGMATPVGTPPNLVFMEQWELFFPDRPAIGFGQWMLFGVPYTLLYLLLTWLLMTRVLFRMPAASTADRQELRDQVRALGRATRDEKLAAIIFCATAALWITGDRIAFSDNFVFPGWRALPWKGLAALGDPAVAMIGGILLFLIPSQEKGRTLLDWDFAQARIPWGVVLLIGSGFAIAGGIDATGLSTTIGHALAAWRTGTEMTQVGAIAMGVTLLSELGSNTAVASLVLPVLARTAEAWQMLPQAVMIPATLGASCGFMLPIASPMQAIVFSSGHLSVRRMVTAGIWMDLLGVLLLMGLWALMGHAVFG